jgi:SP family arabinose:H+ symporter-like MFS transporter
MNPQLTSLDRDRPHLLYFSMLCFIAAIGGLLFGFDTAVISGAIGFLEKQFELGPIMLGWLVSSALVGCLIGAASGGWLSDRFGRKTVLMLSATLFVATSLGCALAPGTQLLIIARLIGGIGVGIASVVVPLYIAEISPAHLRGRMVSFYQFAIAVGVLAAYFSNAALLEVARHCETSADMVPWCRWMFVDQIWRGMLGSLALPAGAFLLLLFLVPESPRWLTKQGRANRALDILSRIGGRTEAQRQMDEIRETISHEAGNLGQLLQPGMRRALGIAVFLACSAQLSGINAIIYYGPKILENAGYQVGKALSGQVILGLVNVVFTVLAMWKMDTMGRRPLLFIGNMGVFVSLVMVGLFFATGVTTGIWLVIFMSAYLASFAFSLGPIPWVVMSEIFPTRIRGRAMSIATLSLWLANTLVCQTFPWMDKHLGPAVSFWAYASMVFPLFLFVWKIMPETKGRSLEELEKSFRPAPEGESVSLGSVAAVDGKTA